MTHRSLVASLALITCSALGASASGQTPPRWRVDSSSNKAGGPRTVELRVHSELPVDGWPGGFIPTLAVKCAGNVPTAFVVTGLPATPEAGTPGHYSVFYHLDDKPRIDEVWAETPSSDTLVSPNASALIHELLQAKRFRFAYTPDHSTLTILDFPLTGFGAALAKVSSDCGPRS